MILEKDIMERSFCDAIFNAVKEWELRNEIMCDYDLKIIGFKLRDHAVRKHIQKEETR